MKKSKFGLLNFDSVEILSREEMKKVRGGYGNDGNFIIATPSYYPPLTTFDKPTTQPSFKTCYVGSNGQAYSTKSSCTTANGGDGATCQELFTNAQCNA